MEFIAFIMAHQTEVLSIFAAAMALGGAVVKITPTKVDDAWFKAIKRAFGITAVCVMLCLPMGCSAFAGPQGVGFNVGQSSVEICKGEPQTCTKITGAPMSESASNVAGGLIAGVLRFLGMSYGVPAAPSAPP